MIKFDEHFINNLLTFTALNLINIYEKLKLINNSLKLPKILYRCLIMLIKLQFYNKKLKILN